MTLTVLMLLAVLQEPAATPAPAPTETLTPPATAAAAPVGPRPEWQRLAVSDTRAYLADIGGMSTEGDVTTFRVASVKRRPPSPDDRAYLADDYAFDCKAGKYRSIRSIDVPAEGGEGDVFDSADAEWEDIPGQGLIASLKEVACDGARADSNSFPTLDAYLATARE